MDSSTKADEKPSGAPPRQMAPMFVKNLFLTIFLGVMVSAWIIAYTDWFSEFASLLALGGLLSWLAFVAKILPEDRIKDLQNWADTSILNRSRTASILGYLFLIGFLASLFLGTVEVQSLDTADRGVTIARTTHGEATSSAQHTEQKEGERLPPGGRIRSVFWTFAFWPTSARVRVTGYPDQVTLIHPLRSSKLYVPASFLRPALLVKPGPKLMTFPSGFRIRIYLNTSGEDTAWSVWDEVNFDGHAFWIGCDKEVEIPRHALESLREDLKSLSDGERSRAVQFWFNVHTGSPKSLPPGARVRLAIVSKDQELPSGKPEIIRQPDNYLDFPQILDIEAP